MYNERENGLKIVGICREGAESASESCYFIKIEAKTYVQKMKSE